MKRTEQSMVGRTIIVIGGTAGLGFGGAGAVVAAGGNVVVVGHEADAVARAQLLLGERAVCICGDARDPGTADAAVAAALSAFGRVDGLYHVAGGSGRRFGDGRLDSVTDEGIDYTLDLNLKSVLYSNRAVIRQLLAQGEGGSILNMGSVLGQSPSPHHFSTHVYAAAKAAIVGLSRSLAATYAPDNIRVNVLAPAVVDTPMAQRAVQDPAISHFLAGKQPLDGGRPGHADDYDAAVVYFLSAASRFTTGQVLAIDGGWSLSDGQILGNPQ